jgi:hypothetical protein
MEGSGQSYILSPLPPAQDSPEPTKYEVGRPRAGFDLLDLRKSYAPAEIRNRVVKYVFH